MKRIGLADVFLRVVNGIWYKFSINKVNITAQESPSNQVSVSRIYGSDRYETAVEVSKQGWNNGADNVILATGENFPDSLCAAPLAAKLNAPILLTYKETLNSYTKNEIKRLNAKNVYIIGLEGAVSENIETEIKTMGIKVIRVGGIDRYETAYKVAKMLNRAEEAFVVTGENFPDALSVSVIAAKKQMPIILAGKDTLINEFIEYIQANNVTKTYLLGGPDVISDSVAEKLPNVMRIFGYTRYDTNLELINEFYDDFKYEKIFIATGENFPDALSAAPLAVKSNSPIILSNGYFSGNFKNFIESNLYSLKNITFLGGETVISSSIIDNLNYNKEANAQNPLCIRTYDGSNQSCHPKVMYFRNGWNGWKYWMVYTPYPNGNDYYENPSIAVSQNGVTWFTPTGVTNPLVPSPDITGCHNSDPHLVYNSSADELEVWYRYTDLDGKDCIYNIVSSDGVNWSPPKIAYDIPAGEECLSPAVLFEDGEYKMWYVNEAFKCMYVTFNPVNNDWATPSEVKLGLETIYLPWHLDVVHTDLGYEMMLTIIKSDEVQENKIKTYILSHSISEDVMSFGSFDIVLNAKLNSDSWDNSLIYRSTFVKVDGIYKLYYSAMDTNYKWHIGLTQGINLKELQGYNYFSCK